jgi:hypothetical protein
MPEFLVVLLDIAHGVQGVSRLIEVLKEYSGFDFGPAILPIAGAFVAVLILRAHHGLPSPRLSIRK